MSRYNWSLAPAWANFATQDRDGGCAWWESEPVRNFEFGMFQSARKGGSRSARMDKAATPVNYSFTCEHRPSSSSECRRSFSMGFSY